MLIDYTEARTPERIADIASFLGVAPAQIGKTQTRKRNSDDMLDRFANPAAVEKYLEENDLDHWRVEQ